MSADSPLATPVVLVSTAKAGGAERALAALVRHLPAFGFRPAVVLLEDGPPARWLADGGCRTVVSAAPGQDVAGLVDEVVRRERALAVVSSKWDAHEHAGRAAAMTGVPALWWQHDIARPTEAQRRAAAWPAAAVVCSSDLAVRAQRRLTPDARIVKIAPGAAVDVIARAAGQGAAVRRSLGWDGQPIVGIVGRLQRFKGQHVFLEAAELVSRTRPDARFLVVGDAILGTEGSYPDDLRRLAERLGIAKRVRFVGHQTVVAPWFDALDVAVHATDGEPFGLVVVEAMAAGAPVVATAGGPSEIVVDGESGLLVPPGQPEVVAGAVTRLLSDRALAERLAGAGRRRARTFTEQRMARSFATVLRELVGVAGS